MPDQTGNRLPLYGALLVAWVAMLGSLYFSQELGYIPCTLCWYQRILMYPLAGMIALGLLRRDVPLPYLILPFSILGQGFSTYHYLLQKTQFFSSATTCQVGVPCSSSWINWLGFITIPFLAMMAFLLITLLTVIYMAGQSSQSEPDGEPNPSGRTLDGRRSSWLPVLLTTGSVALIFGVMAQIHQPTAAGESESHLPLATIDAAAQIEAAQQGRTLYVQACAACHGPDAQGIEHLGPTLVASPVIVEQSEEEALALIRAGILLDNPENQSGLVMPPSGGRPDLSDVELLSVIRYLKAAF